MASVMSKEQRIRRHLARMQSQKASKAFCAWRDDVRLHRLQEDFLSSFPLSVCEAFGLPPAQRVRQHIDQIYDLVRGQDFPWAKALPDAALRHACRHMSFEVLQDDMVLPRGPEDDFRFFAVYCGAPVQVAYGTLGASIRSHALELTKQCNQAECGTDLGPSDIKVEDAELVHAYSSLDTIDARHADQTELAWRRRAHAHLSPANLNQSWGLHLQPASTPWQDHGPPGTDAQLACDHLCPQSTVQGEMAALSPGAAMSTRAQTPLQHALLGPGEVFTGTRLNGWTKQSTAWPSPIQAHVTRSSPGLFSVVLILPGDVVLELVEVVMQQHLRRTVDLCLRVPAFRHLSVSVLTGLAQYCNESRAPSRHELLRQHHPITHVHLLISGSVDVTAFVPACCTKLDPLTLSCCVHSDEFPGLTTTRLAEKAESQASRDSHSAEFGQFKLKLGQRHGPCVLGDEPSRSSKTDSLVSVATASPCHLLSVPVASFKASMEGMTSRLFNQLRKPENTFQVLLEAACMHHSLVAAELRDRNTKLEEVFGRAGVPLALDRTPGPRSPAPAWMPPHRKLGLFLDFVTLDQGERGAYESPQQQVARVVNLVILHLVDAVGGLPALAARMQMSSAGKSFALFADSIVRELVQNRLGMVPLHEVLAAVGEGELPAGAEEAVRARLIALGMLAESRVRTTPLVKQVRSTSVAALGQAEPAHTRKYWFLDLEHRESRAARSTHSIETLDSACLIQLSLQLAPWYLQGRPFQQSASCLDTVALAWAGRCAKRAGSRLIRLSSHTHAVVMPVDCSNERVSVALDACVLACDMRELADEACKEATPAMPFLVTAVLSYGCVTMLTQHGKCVTSLRGSAVQSGAVILEAASGACHRRGHMVIAADTLQSLVVDQYRWLPRDGGHTLEQPISSRQCLLGNPGALMEADVATGKPASQATDLPNASESSQLPLLQLKDGGAGRDKERSDLDTRAASKKPQPLRSYPSKDTQKQCNATSTVALLRQRQSMTAMDARKLVRQDLQMDCDGRNQIALHGLNRKPHQPWETPYTKRPMQKPAAHKYCQSILSAAKAKGSKRATGLYLQGTCRCTASVDVCGSDLESIPLCNSVAQLQRISASCNQLTEFPSLEAPLLCRLNLAHNRVGSLPEAIAQWLPNLKELDLSYNRLHCLPRSIRSMAELCTMNVKHNQLACLPEMDGLHALWYLDASDNTLVELPASLADSCNLSHVNFSGNKLKTIPSWISSLKGLEFLSFAGNLIKDGVNLDLCNLQHLCVLDLACNSLSKLDLTGNQDTAKEWTPPKLHSLYLSDNMFCSLPESIPDTLVRLDVSQNGLVSLPTWLSTRCVELTEVMLHNNGILSVDDALLRLPHLQLLTLHHNPLCCGLSSLAEALSQGASVAAIKQAMATDSNRPPDSNTSSPVHVSTHDG